jgi:hypothetical protein
MTIRRDYLLRLIEEFFKFLSKILKLKEEKHYQQALALIDETSLSLLHIDLTGLMTDEISFSKITQDKALSLDKIEILAELLKVKAEISDETNAIFSAINLYEKSLFLFEHVQVTSNDYSMSRANRIQEITHSLLNLKG